MGEAEPYRSTPSRPSLGLLTVVKRQPFPVSSYSQGKLCIPHVCQDITFSAEELKDEGELGRGSYGYVNRMIHQPTNSVMAVKRIRCMLNEHERKTTLRDLDIVMKSGKCPNIVQFYGALFKEGDCWICMELMTASLDDFYRYVYLYLHKRIPENVLGKITVATVSALNYLKTALQVIHRDVKPSNILIDLTGSIKLCDFGISGPLIDSIAKTRDAGNRPYMAPERINPPLSTKGYDIRSDVWSFGITLIELATGNFPYPPWNSPFEQLTHVVEDAAPALPESLPKQLAQSPSVTTLMDNSETLTNGDASDDEDLSFSSQFREFVANCLRKDVTVRPKYDDLMKMNFFTAAESADVDVGAYFSGVFGHLPSGISFHTFLQAEA